MNLDDVTVQMVPGEATEYNGYSVWSIHKNATIDVINEYFRPYQPDLSYDSLPITELIESDYYTTDVYDENQDTLQDIADGATPGESKKKTTETHLLRKAVMTAMMIMIIIRRKTTDTN